MSESDFNELKIVSTFICFECASEIHTEEDEDPQHDPECPTQTNYWIVEEPEGIGCALCLVTIPQGHRHRFIPRLPEDEVDPEGVNMGRYQPGGKPLVVCMPCCRLRAVPSVDPPF